MSEFVQSLLILAMFLAFIFSIFLGYQIKVKDSNKEIIVDKDKDKDNHNKKK